MTHDIFWVSRTRVKCSCGWTPIGRLDRYDAQRAVIKHMEEVRA